ncbi:MAG: alpha/beta hydrolase [Phenylobacterium sp.]|uniref:alpha/beta fold hydrolase n=1 Tax=Phenylobacterium sp. TaxID=1871053 RepID=UPI0027284DD9|nr:alpha/beta hydrolase [Phenylobacterium sp.]MDO8410116.1 alpha/beta hydrolase [Phenylobacterium sp.]
MRPLTTGLLAALSLAALAALGTGARAYHRDMTQARAALAGRSQVVETAFGPVEYAEDGQGPAVLVIHGSGGGFDQGLAFSEPLTGVRRISPSRFGYLQSPMPAGATPEMQADALAELLGALATGPVVILGGSAGALSATQLALRHPELCRGLVLVAPALYAPDRAPDARAPTPPVVDALIQAALGSDLVFWLGMKAAPDLMVRTVLGTDPALLTTATASERRRVSEVLFHILPIRPRRDGLIMDGATSGAPPPYDFDRIACPVLAIAARDDLYGTDRAAVHVAQLAPTAELVLFEEGGHLWVGHDQALWAAVAEFISAQAADAP